MPRRKRTTLETQIGRRIKTRRRELKLSQAALAVQIGVSTQQVQKYEYGKDRLFPMRLLALSKALQMTPHALLGYEQ
jgi:transcriptional regulator with XRE-family HTH domain